MPALNPIAGIDPESGDFRLPDDGWVQIAPAGRFPIAVRDAAGRTVQLVQVLDADAFDAIIADFANRAGEAGLLVDYDHFSLDADKSSEAAGWITALENRGDAGLWARIRWSAKGLGDVAGGNYRFLSPVFDAASATRPAGGEIRPTRLVRAALTNDPNLRGILPLSNRSAAPDRGGQEKEKDTVKEKLIPLLELGEDADESAILAEVRDLRNRAQKAEAAEQRVRELETAALEARVEKDLDEFKDVIANRDEVKKSLLANREAALAVLRNLRTPQPGAALPNRRDGSVPAGGPASGGDGAESAKRAAAVRNRAAEISRTQGVPFIRAFELAEAELG